MEARTKRIMVVAGVEIAFGIAEGVVVPNFVMQKIGPGWKFKLPARDVFFRTMGILLVTGIISGYIADHVMVAVEGTDAPDTQTNPGGGVVEQQTEEAAAGFLKTIAGIAL